MDQQRLYFNQPEEEIDSIYYQRELLCHSLDGLRIDLLTISSYHGITMETEPRLPGLFPDVCSDRSQVFKDKKVSKYLRRTDSCTNRWTDRYVHM